MYQRNFIIKKSTCLPKLFHVLRMRELKIFTESCDVSMSSQYMPAPQKYHSNDKSERVNE